MLVTALHRLAVLLRRLQSRQRRLGVQSRLFSPTLHRHLLQSLGDVRVLQQRVAARRVHRELRDGFGKVLRRQSSVSMSAV